MKLSSPDSVNILSEILCVGRAPSWAGCASVTDKLSDSGVRSRTSPPRVILTNKARFAPRKARGLASKLMRVLIRSLGLARRWRLERGAARRRRWWLVPCRVFRHPDPPPTRPSPSMTPAITTAAAGAIISAALALSAAIATAAFQPQLLHRRRAHSPLLLIPPPRHPGKESHPPYCRRRHQPSIQAFGAGQHAEMAATRRRSSSAGNWCLPVQLYGERLKAAPGLAI